MFHRITIIGFVGQPPQMRYTEDGTAVTNFSVATRQVVSKERVAGCPQGWKESLNGPADGGQARRRRRDHFRRRRVVGPRFCRGNERIPTARAVAAPAIDTAPGLELRWAWTAVPEIVRYPAVSTVPVPPMGRHVLSVSRMRLKGLLDLLLSIHSAFPKEAQTNNNRSRTVSSWFRLTGETQHSRAASLRTATQPTGREQRNKEQKG